MIKSCIRYIIIFAFMFILIFPLLWMVKGSFENLQGLILMPPTLIPRKATLDNYINMLTIAPGNYGARLSFPVWPMRWALNTLKILIIKLILVIIISSMAAYAFSVYRFKGRNILFTIYIAGLVLPPVMLIPTFVVMKKLGFYGTHWGMIIPAAYNAWMMYMLKIYMDTIPRSFIDSARIEGAGEVRILSQIILPLCKPPLGVGIVIVTMDTLKEYIWGLIMLPKYAKWTFMVGMMDISRNALSIPGTNPLGAQLAVGVITFIPLFVVFVFCQKYFIKGIQMRAIK